MEFKHLIAKEDYTRLEKLYNDVNTHNTALRAEITHLNDVLDGWKDVYCGLEKNYSQLQNDYTGLKKQFDANSEANSMLTSQLEEMLGIVHTQHKQIQLYEFTLKKQAETGKAQKEKISQYEAKIKQFEDKEKAKSESVRGKSFHPTVRFSEIGGLQSLIVELERFAYFAKQPEKYLELGMESHYSLLMHGPPGCGKTMIGEAIASELGYAFIKINIPEIVSKWLGETEQNLQKVFTQCREIYEKDHTRVVLFLDEADSLLRARGVDNSSAMDRVLNVWLQETEVLSRHYGTVIVAATNRFDDLDVAAIRRFKRTIHVPLPNEVALRDILEKQVRVIERKREDHCTKSGRTYVPLFETLDYSCLAHGLCAYDASGSDVGRVLEQVRENLLDSGEKVITTGMIGGVTKRYFESRVSTKQRRIGLHS